MLITILGIIAVVLLSLGGISMIVGYIFNISYDSEKDNLVVFLSILAIVLFIMGLMVAFTCSILNIFKEAFI